VKRERIGLVEMLCNVFASPGTFDSTCRFWVRRRDVRRKLAYLNQGLLTRLIFAVLLSCRCSAENKWGCAVFVLTECPVAKKSYTRNRVREKRVAHEDGVTHMSEFVLGQSFTLNDGATRAGVRSCSVLTTFPFALRARFACGFDI
jgi:hypothetical protein